MILIHCCECHRVVGKAEKLYERLGMTVYCRQCVADLHRPEKTAIPDFLNGLNRKRKP